MFNITARAAWRGLLWQYDWILINNPPSPSFLPFQSLKVVFREPLPANQPPSTSPPPQLVSMYHHLESVVNTACYNLWTGLL